MAAEKGSYYSAELITACKVLWYRLLLVEHSNSRWNHQGGNLKNLQGFPNMQKR